MSAIDTVRRSLLATGRTPAEAQQLLDSVTGPTAPVIDERDTLLARVAELENLVLPDRDREIQHHKNGKARWRGRAESAEAKLKAAPEPLVVSRFDVVMESAPEDEPTLTIGAIAEDGRPVAIVLTPETRAQIAGWLAPDQANERQFLLDRVAELEAFAYGCDGEGCTLPHSSWCDEAQQAAAENGGCTCAQSEHAGHCWLVSPPRAEVDEMRKRIAELAAAQANAASAALLNFAERLTAKAALMGAAYLPVDEVCTALRTVAANPTPAVAERPAGGAL
ncbi:hypothetical protein ACWCWD_06585 [Streptomyces sp. NPDC001493]